MKRLIFIMTLFGLFAQTKAQTSKEILREHFEVNGQQIWDQIESVIVVGRWVTKEYKGYPIRLTYKRPEKIRIEGKWNKQRFVEATNGRIAWEIAPWEKSTTPELMKPLEQLVIKNAYNMGSPLKLYEHDLQFNGLIDFKGTLFLNFTFETPFLKKDFYLGREDYRLYWEVIETKAGSKKFKVEKEFEKYRIYNALLLPTAVRIYTEKGEKELVFDDITLGAGASSRLFEMPTTE